MPTRSKSSVETVFDELIVGDVPLFIHPAWADGFPWLLQGTSGAGPPNEPFDLALFGDHESAGVRERWDGVAAASGFHRVVHSRQPHGCNVHVHSEGPPGFAVVPPSDGHASRTPGVLMAIAVADCVPVFLVDPSRRAVALLHAGWRGVAAGILERGLQVLCQQMASRTGDVHMHLGPAICGSCYEVGSEVFEALHLAAPGERGDLDLRTALVARAVRADVGRDRISVSGHCTRCDGSPFFSHRAGDPQRQAAFLGVKP
ncbi:MAG: hypothetical protein BMS9Abin29_0429 [Gemmatimonadota bacterium]|nr:MAG: hypothetical protein BMS9Abin29_0429 [Gemmatimonadota bacterium]